MKRFVIITVLATRGSAPRDAGTQMLVSADKILGSIGGGKLEYQAMQVARELLADNKPIGFNQQQDCILGTEMGQCCGGQVRIGYQLTDKRELWQDPLQTTSQQFNIVLFGAGHVGQAIVNILATQPCQVHWVDSRSDIFPSALPANVTCHHPKAPASLVSAMPAESYYLVMTHDHGLDLEICDHVLSRGQFRFLGLIGSATKAARFKRQLLRRGLTQQDIERLTCPIGINGIAGKLPSSIALAVVAQLVGLEEKATLTPRPPLPEGGGETGRGTDVSPSPSGRGVGVRVKNRSVRTGTKIVPSSSPLPQPFPKQRFQRNVRCKGGRELNRLPSEILS